MKLKELVGKGVQFANQKSPEILTGLALVGLVGTAIAAYKAGLAADEILKKRREDMAIVAKGDREARAAVNREFAKKMVPKLVAPVVFGTATAACVLGSHTASTRKIAVISAAYSAAETSIKDLNGKMREVLGESKTQQIKDAVTKDKLKKDNGGVPNPESIIVTGNGTVKCKDMFSGRYFWSNAQTIKQAINKLSYDIISDTWISLNDFYSEINLEPIPDGDRLGWDIDDTDRGRLPITVTAILSDDDTPCLCVEYDIYVSRDVLNSRML